MVFNHQLLTVYGKSAKLANSETRGVKLVDGMKLSESIFFDSESMKFSGFVDLGRHTPEELKNKAADHAVVFKFVPSRGRWTQALGCFLSRMACTSIPLHKLLIECIVLLENSGIHVDAVVTDGATRNRDVWRIFGIDTNNISCEHPYNSDQRLWMISVFNHLTKCFRNGITKEQFAEFMTPYGMIKRKHWEAVLEEEKYRQPNLKIAHKLSPAHIKPRGFQQMNVPLANELFGHEVAVAMEHLQQTREDLIDFTPTQKFIKLMNKLVEAMSSRITRDALKVQEDSVKRKTIIEFLQFIGDWEKLGIMPVSKETILGYKITLRATLETLNALNIECDYSYLMTATISQDPLERFFSVMRFSCGGNDHPDPKMFTQVYRLASGFSLIRPPRGANVDGVDLLRTLLEVKDTTNGLQKSKQAWLNSIGSILDDKKPKSYIGRKLKKIRKCDNCSHTLELDKNDGKMQARNDVINRMDLYGGLFCASDQLFELTKRLEKCILRTVAKELINIETISQIGVEISKVQLETVGCCLHSKDLTKKVIDLYIVMRARFLGNSENKRYQLAKDKVKMHRKNAELLTQY